MNISELKKLIQEEVNNLFDEKTNILFRIKKYNSVYYLEIYKKEEGNIGGLYLDFDLPTTEEMQKYKASKLYKKGQNIFTMRSVEIFPKFREKGYGKMLIEKAIEFAKSKNVNVIILGVLSSNKAINLYKSFGFKTFAEGVGPDMALKKYSPAEYMCLKL